MTHVLFLVVMDPSNILIFVASSCVLSPDLLPITTFCSCSNGGDDGRIGPHGPTDGTCCSMRDVSAEPCPTRTSRLCEQYTCVGTRSSMIAALEQGSSLIYPPTSLPFCFHLPCFRVLLSGLQFCTKPVS